MPETAKVFEDRGHAGNWRVEWFDDDGGCEVEIFAGPNARERARRYAEQRYEKFEEIRLEPYPYDTTRSVRAAEPPF
jgi:hypothetical protein